MMTIVLPALLALVALLLVQVVVWRLVPGVRQYVALPVLIVLVLIGSLAVFWTFGRTASAVVPASPFEVVNVVLLYGALAMAYFVTYPAIQADSPSMTVLLIIERAGAAGLSREELDRALGDDVLVLPRLDDLVAGHVVSVRGDRYVVGAGGAALARLHLGYRALLRMEKGG